MSGVIEEDGKVEFAETGAKPDSLEQTVAGVGTAGSGNKIVSGGLLNPEATEKVWVAYLKLREMLVAPLTVPTENNYKSLICNSLRVSYKRSNSRNRVKFDIPSLNPSNLLEILKPVYGPEVVDMDIGQELLASEDGTVPEKLYAIIPELTTLKSLNAMEVDLKGGDTSTSPYLHALYASPEHRELIIGGMILAEAGGLFDKIRGNNKADISELAPGCWAVEWKKEFGPYLVKYALSIGQKKIIPVLQELQNIPIIT